MNPVEGFILFTGLCVWVFTDSSGGWLTAGCLIWPLSSLLTRSGCSALDFSVGFLFAFAYEVASFMNYFIHLLRKLCFHAAGVVQNEFQQIQRDMWMRSWEMFLGMRPRMNLA